jgi:hypothetical protein
MRSGVREAVFGVVRLGQNLLRAGESALLNTLPRRSIT